MRGIGEDYPPTRERSIGDFPPSRATGGNTLIMVIYGLFLFGLFNGLSAIVGVVVAYVYKPDAALWQQSHYRFQIRTFWIGLPLLIFGTVTTLIGIGYLILLFWLVWTLVRCVRGVKLANAFRPVPDPLGWGFGG